jgi:hypothetical protein
MALHIITCLTGRLRQSADQIVATRAHDVMGRLAYFTSGNSL